MAAALALSVAYYAHEARVEAAPVDPVRLMGVLLAGAGLAFGATTYLIATRGLPSLPVPVGVILLHALGGVLLRVESARAGPADAAGSGEWL